MTAAAGGASTSGSAAAAGAGYALAFTGMFLALGAQIAFLQVWLDARGLGEREIGALLALATAARVAGSVLLPAIADMTGRPKTAMAGLALLGATASALLLAVDGRTAIWALTVTQAFAFAGLAPVVESHAYAEAPRRGFSFPKVRSIGSAAFLAATLGAGFAIGVAGPDAAMVWMAIAFALAALGGVAAPVTPPLPRDGGPASLSAQLGDRLRAWAGLLIDTRFLVFLLAIGALQASHGVYYVYGSLHWAALGWSPTVIGALWALGVAAEIVLFALAGAWVARIPTALALAAAGLAGLVRWGAMTIDPGLTATAALQILHAGTFGLAHLAALGFIARSAPAGLAASAQGLMGATGNGALTVATLGAAVLYPAIGAGAYWLAAGLAVAGGALALAGLRQPER